jgi:hypothetical protein
MGVGGLVASWAMSPVVSPEHNMVNKKIKKNAVRIISNSASSFFSQTFFLPVGKSRCGEIAHRN